MIRKILIALGLLVVGLLGVILFRTFTYGGSVVGDRVELPTSPDIPDARVARHLSEAIQFKTITLQAGDPREGQEGPWLSLHDWLIETYPEAHRVMSREIIPDTYSLLYTWEGSDETLAPLLFMAHQDVVPVNMGTESDWGAPAFSGEIKDGYVYGRGAIDDKNSLVALMDAADALAASGYQPKRTILFMFGHDEEVSGSGAQAGVALLKARGIEPELVLDEGFMVIDPSPLTGKPMGFVGIAEKGYLTLNLTVSAAGGHSSTPPRNSAVIELSRALVALDENQMPADFSKQPVSGLFASAAKDMPFVQKMAFANLWLFQPIVDSSLAEIPAGNAMVRTTTAPTMLSGSAKENVLAQRATAIINFRLHPNDTIEDVIAHVKDVTSNIENISVEVSGDSMGSPASPVSPTDNKAYAVIASVAESIGNGAPATPALVVGATDARFASEISPNVYRFQPARISSDDLRGFHGTNERIEVDVLGDMAEGYAQIIMAMDAE